METDPERPIFGEKDFVHLHLHTDYSLLHSTIQLKPLAAKLQTVGQKACAITDYGNLYGAVSFFNTMTYAGLQPIIGYEAYLKFGSMTDRSTSIAAGERGYYNLVLIAKNIEGYHDLIHLSSKAFTEGFFHKPRIDDQILRKHSKGLIALSGGRRGPVGHFLDRGDEERARENALVLKDIFGDDFYLEIHPDETEEDKRLLVPTATLGTELGISLVATNDVHYLNAEDAAAQKLLIAIGEGRTISDAEREQKVGTNYLRTSEEMWEIFGRRHPDALENTVEIANKCDLKIPQGDDVRQLPNYPIPDEFRGIDDYFEKVLRDGFEDRKRTEWMPMLELGTLVHSLDEYEERLNIELETIKKMGFPGYFLIVWDFIAYARKEGIPVGPGRGSAAGSLAAYCLRITDVDPIQYELLFERFLNPERISMPDIDIDFCIRGRGQVIEHVSELYGRESVCQIITFGTMASRAAIKDVGRALNLPYGDVEKVAKLIPPPIRGRNVSISQALETVPELKAAIKDPKIKELVDLALKLEGCSRHTSVHAAGVVISPRPLHELVPVAISGKEELTSQYPMGDLEKVGMLKMDFLGLTTLTVISDCLRSMREKLGVEIDWATIPTNDAETMELFGEGRTEAIFQFESSGMQDMCRRLRPKELEDLSALNALYRPGPLDGGMIDDFIDRHRGIKPVEYIVPEMENILGNTFGVLVYQEQIMQLAQRLAGYSLGEADLMRRAMGKKKKEDMDDHREKFVAGAVKNSINKRTATEIFELMAKFADYGFNRSHSMAYALLAFQTAYLKAHYPAHFYSSVLSHESQDSAKVYKYSTELRSMGLELLPPDVNDSGDGFTPVDATVRYGLTAIKGMGSSSVAAMVKARKDGRFTSLFDFCGRLGPGAINRRGLESLIAAGAFDSMMPPGAKVESWRARLHEGIDGALQQGIRLAEDRLRGQVDLFGAGSTESGEVIQSLPDAEPWSRSELASREKAAIGFYLSTHPLDDFQDLLSSLRLKNIADHGELQSGQVAKLAGMITGLQVRTSKRGNRFAQFRFEDRSGGIKGVLLGDNFNKLSPLLADDGLFIAEGNIEAPEGQEPTLKINSLQSLRDAESSSASEVRITLPSRELSEDFFEGLYGLLERDRGRSSVVLNMCVAGADVTLRSDALAVNGSRSLQTQLEAKGCVVKWVG